jgi:hypothetical protein
MIEDDLLRLFWKNVVTSQVADIRFVSIELNLGSIHAPLLSVPYL